MSKGLFITFEGVEGAGKTTQLQHVDRYFSSLQREVVFTLEPGGTSFGQSIRSLLLDRTSDFSHSLTELLLFSADRLEHINTCIHPALASGKVVCCDRFIDSTVAYQHGGRQLDRETVDYFIQLVELVPDHTFLFDIDPRVGLERAHGRGELDRFEQETIDFHDRVRASYLDSAQRDPKRFTVISVENKTDDEVFSEVSNQLDKLIH